MSLVDNGFLPGHPGKPEVGMSFALISMTYIHHRSECDTLSVGVAGVIAFCCSVPYSLWQSPYKEIVNLTNVSGHKMLLEQDWSKIASMSLTVCIHHRIHFERQKRHIADLQAMFLHHHHHDHHYHHHHLRYFATFTWER